MVMVDIEDSCSEFEVGNILHFVMSNITNMSEDPKLIHGFRHNIRGISAEQLEKLE